MLLNAPCSTHLENDSGMPLPRHMDLLYVPASKSVFVLSVLNKCSQQSCQSLKVLKPSP